MQEVLKKMRKRRKNEGEQRGRQRKSLVVTETV